MEETAACVWLIQALPAITTKPEFRGILPGQRDLRAQQDRLDQQDPQVQPDRQDQRARRVQLDRPGQQDLRDRRRAGRRLFGHVRRRITLILAEDS